VSPSRRSQRVRITAQTRWAAVIGAPVDHSLSPALHNAAFAALDVDAVYLALHIEPADLENAVAGVRAQRPIGGSVTVPHKEAVVALCDRVEPPADRIGAVNCLVVDVSGAIIGHNTDAPGFIDALRVGLGFDPTGRRAVLLGAGGAARAVLVGLADAGAASTQVIARRPETASFTEARPWTREALEEALADCDLLVDCTSAGLDPHSEAQMPAPIPLDRLPADAVVATLVYHRETTLLASAKHRGFRVLDGALMLIHQAARAFELWIGQPAPLEAMHKAWTQVHTAR
jgi:shikimate dehydrogenase